MSKLALIVVAYNRENGMLRLLHSLENALYRSDPVTLIISIDNSGSDSVLTAADRFHWSHGEKRIRTFSERQGLRKHILSCGDFLKEFDAVAVFEDDIIVSPDFYDYMVAAVEYYRDDENIAGISLYTPATNWNAQLPFIHSYGKSDVFFMQYAQSWGQIWMKKQWQAFADWYSENKDFPVKGDHIPFWVTTWKDTSWLKYHIKYCIETDKFFVYPNVSLTTCFNDVGEHSKKANHSNQVQLLTCSGKSYTFEKMNSESVIYDAFFEREGLDRYLGPNLCTDIYGTKRDYSSYDLLLTTKSLPYKVIRSFGLQLRPHENNIIYSVNGRDIFLYDLHQNGSGAKRKHPFDRDYDTVSYYFNITSNWKRMFCYIMGKIKGKIKKN